MELKDLQPIRFLCREHCLSINIYEFMPILEARRLSERIREQIANLREKTRKPGEVGVLEAAMLEGIEGLAESLENVSNSLSSLIDALVEWFMEPQGNRGAANLTQLVNSLHHLVESLYELAWRFKSAASIASSLMHISQALQEMRSWQLQSLNGLTRLSIAIDILVDEVLCFLCQLARQVYEGYKLMPQYYERRGDRLRASMIKLVYATLLCSLLYSIAAARVANT